MNYKDSIFILNITQYNFTLLVNFSLIGLDPKVSLLLAGVVKLFVDHENSLCLGGEGGAGVNLFYINIYQRLQCLYLLNIDWTILGISHLKKN